MLWKLQAVGKRSQTGDQLQSDQARQQDSHQRNDCQIQQHRPRTPFIKMNQQKRQHRHGNAQTGKDIFAEETAGPDDGSPGNIPPGNSIGDSQRGCCVLPAILQNRNHPCNPEHCRKESWKPASRIRCGLGTSRSNAATAREVGRSGVRFSSPAAKNSKNMTSARRVEMPIPVSCAYTIRIHVEIPALKAAGSRTFSKVRTFLRQSGTGAVRKSPAGG